jgi:putative membrane protein
MSGREWAGKASGTGYYDQTGLGGNTEMIRLLANWVLSAVAMLLVSRVVPGFHVDSLGTALVAALVFGLLNATLGLLLKLVTLPLSILTLGLFLLVVNAFLLQMASGLVAGFHIRSFTAAFWGAAVLALVQMLFRFLLNGSEKA